MHKIVIIGGGLAGSEAALQLANRGLDVTLYDMKPVKRSPAHHSNHLAEIVCSNSFGSQGETMASGLLKLELDMLGCELMTIAQSIAVPAGKALAVDRDQFSELVTEKIRNHPNIKLIAEDVTEIPAGADYILVATGPMTSPGLVESLSKLLNREQLYFFDAASPILTKDSINFDIAFIKDRYNASSEGDTTDSGSYINCPLNKAEYLALVDKLLSTEKTELKSFEKESAKYFESCLPVEVIASRGTDTLRYGPMKPVGLDDPRTGRWPYAVVQLRQDNAAGTLYNMVGFQTNIKWGAQKEMIQMIPGLESAEVIRYGVMHRNTYIHSPELLKPTLQLKKHPHILFAGQLTGTEGYTESIATGLIAALNIARMIDSNDPIVLPPETMIGSLLRYITRAEAIGKDFQPINSNWGIIPELPSDLKQQLRKDKKERNRQYSKRSLEALSSFIKRTGCFLKREKRPYLYSNLIKRTACLLRPKPTL